MTEQQSSANHPYAGGPDWAFWRSGVVEGGGRGLDDLFVPTVPITSDTPIATAGSCFAQHIGRWLRRSGVNVLDAEPVPGIMSDAVATRFGYRLFSGRYGNIYTARQLVQLLDDVITGHVDPRFVWSGPKGGYVDAFRPTVEPEGIDTVQEVLLHRDYHLERTAQMLRMAEVFVFTLGLTEAWMDRATGRVFPVCPGVAGGRFDPSEHAMQMFRYGEVTEDLHAILARLRRFNPAIRMILTVSPVPLTATASDDHVLTASTGAKATLRAAAGDFASDTSGVDYFPSYELVTSHATGGPWFEPNLRSVSEAGVTMVMSRFLAAHGLIAEAETPRADDPDLDEDADENIHCDELLLQAAR